MTVAETAVVVAPSSTRIAELLHLAEQVVAAVRIELPLHQRRHQVHDGDVAPLDLQPRAASSPSRPPPITTAFCPARRAEQLARVFERAEHEDAVLVEAVDRRHPRGAAGCQQQRVVRRHAAVAAGHGPGVRSRRRRSARHAQVDVCA
jgi:hypothetical protein